MKSVVVYMVASHGHSERRACRLTRQHRSTQRKRLTRDPRLAFRQRMREIVATRIRFGIPPGSYHALQRGVECRT